MMQEIDKNEQIATNNEQKLRKYSRIFFTKINKNTGEIGTKLRKILQNLTRIITMMQKMNKTEQNYTKNEQQ